MKLLYKRIKMTTAGTLAVLAAVVLFGSCKGRTMNDVEANGETIEVVIPEEEPAAEPEIQASDAPADETVVVKEIPTEADTLHAAPLQFQEY